MYRGPGFRGDTVGGGSTETCIGGQDFVEILERGGSTEIL